MLAVALFLVLAFFFFLEILSYLKGSNVLVSNSIRSMPHLSHRTHKEKSLFSKVGSFHTISLVAQDSTLSGWSRSLIHLSSHLSDCMKTAAIEISLDGKLLKQTNSVKYLGVHINRIYTFV